MVRFSEDQLKRLGFAIFRAVGVPADEAEIVTEILVTTSLHGIDSHGVRAIPMYIETIKKGDEAYYPLRPGTPIKVLVDTPTTAMWDAGAAFGFVVGKKAMETAIEKAKRYKFGSVGTTGTGHIGALHYYSLMAAKQDMIGITLCRGGGHAAAPYGGVDGRLGINPFSVAIPAEEHKPIFLDMATTTVAVGHLAVMKTRGQKIPAGWLINKKGEWVQEFDLEALLKGEVAPVGFGGRDSEYKGYGLSVIIEALAGAIGAGCSLDEKGFGHVFSAIDPTGYCPIEDFKARVDSMIRHVKSSNKRPGFKEILVPGEPEWRKQEKRKKEGIFIDDPWWDKIVETAEKLGLDVYEIMK